MFEDGNAGGPYFEAGLMGANGKLKRLHKGASAPPPPPKPPPPVRETARDVQQAKEDEREAARLRRGYNWSLENGGRKGSLLGQGEGKTLLGE